MKIYWLTSGDEESDDVTAESWDEVNLLVSLDDAKPVPDKEYLTVSYNGEGWSKLGYQDMPAIWPYELPSKAYQMFIKGAFQGEL